MATVQSNKAEIDQLRQEITELNTTVSQLLSGSKKFADFTNAEALYTVSNIFKGVVSVDINSSLDKTGLYCSGINPNINDGNYFSGWRSTVASPTTDSDFDIKGLST